MPVYNAVVKMVDHGGRFTTQRFQIFGTDADDAATNLAANVALLQDVTNLGVLSASLTVDATISPSAAAEGSNTDVGGKCKGISYEDGKTVILRVPDPIAAIINSTYGFVLSEEHLEAWLEDFLSTGNGRISDGERVASWQVGALDAR